MHSSERGLGILILAPGELGERLSGPEIRAVRLGRALAAAGHRVTLTAPGGERTEQDGLGVAPYSRTRLLREARRHDVVLASTVPPFLLAAKRVLGVRAVSDQYDPVEIELGTLESGAARARATARAARRLQLRGADLVLCAGDRQRLLLEAELGGLGGSNRPPIEVVPFGIDPSPEPGPSRAHPLRERFGQIEPGDKVILWLGSLWRWLDAQTAIRAVASLAATRPDVKLLFTAGRPPNAGAERHSALEEAWALAANLGVLGRSVFFLEEWIPFERRGEYLRDADLGLTLHRNAEEASVAARARYMDYLWAGLPCVLGRGDETAERFEREGFATLVESGSPQATATAILAALEDGAHERACAAGRRLAHELSWDRVAAPLLGALEGLEAGRPRSSHQVRGATAYYARRAVDRLLPFA